MILLPPPPSAPAWVAAVVGEARARYGLPAVYVGLADGGRTVAVHAAGVRTVGSLTSVEAGDPFPLASISKPVTATVIHRLASQGRIRLDLTVDEALPGLRGTTLARYQGVTLRMLLTHVGGLRRDAEPYAVAGADPVADRLASTRTALTQAGESDPGLKGIYANVGYVVAGCMVETVLKEPLESLAKKALFDPLDLKSFLAAPAYALKRTPVMATPHEITAAGVAVPREKSRDFWWSFTPGGMWLATAGDLTEFGRQAAIAVQGGPSPLRDLYVPANLVTSDRTGTTSLGWSASPMIGARPLSHGGALSFEDTLLWIMPETGTVITVAVPSRSRAKTAPWDVPPTEYLRRELWHGLRQRRPRTRGGELSLRYVRFIGGAPTGKQRVDVGFRIVGARTGDLCSTVSRDGVTVTTDCPTGLLPGDHHLFFDVPAGTGDVTVDLDALKTAGDAVPGGTRYTGPPRG